MTHTTKIRSRLGKTSRLGKRLDFYGRDTRAAIIRERLFKFRGKHRP